MKKCNKSQFRFIEKKGEEVEVKEADLAEVGKRRIRRIMKTTFH